MDNSLIVKISKLRHDGNITDEEYQEIIKKLYGRNKQIITDTIDEFNKLLYAYGWYDIYSTKLTIYKEELDELVKQLKGHENEKD